MKAVLEGLEKVDVKLTSRFHSLFSMSPARVPPFPPPTTAAAAVLTGDGRFLVQSVPQR